MKMHERERWQAIVSALETKQIVTVRDLQKRLRSSAATIRRDLAELESQGKLRRVHGGAERADGHGPAHLQGQPAFADVLGLHHEAKRAIARRAASLCADDEGVIIDGGSTTFAMVEFIKDRRLQVLTNSFPIAEALFRLGSGRVLVPGGELVREQNIILSPFADSVLANFYASRLFMGAQAISPRGVMQTDPLLVQSEQRLLQHAERLVVLVDGSKFRAPASLVVTPLEQIDTLITDASAPRDAVTMLERAGVEVIQVPATATAG